MSRIIFIFFYIFYLVEWTRLELAYDVVYKTTATTSLATTHQELNNTYSMLISDKMLTTVLSALKRSWEFKNHIHNVLTTYIFLISFIFIIVKNFFQKNVWFANMEQSVGIEPTSSAWKAVIIAIIRWLQKKWLEGLDSNQY